MATYAVRYTQPIMGTDAQGDLVPQPGASVRIRKNGATATVYANRTKTGLDNPVPIGVAGGVAGLDTFGNLTVWLDPTDGHLYDAEVTVGGTTTIVAIQTICPESGDVVAPNVPGRRVEIAAAAAGAATDAAIADAYTSAGANGLVVWPGNRTYTTTAPVVVTCATLAEPGAILSPNHNGVGLQLGSGTVELNEKELRLPQVKKQTRVYTVSPLNIGTDIGIKCVRVIACEVHVPLVQYFSIGLSLEPTGNAGDAVAYNTFYLRTLRDNAINRRIKCTGAGFVNQNKFTGGRSVHNESGTPLVGTRQYEILFPAGTQVPNQNADTDVSLEGDGPEYHLVCGGRFNTFRYDRWESASPKVRWTDGASNNEIVGGYDVHKIVPSADGVTSVSDNYIATRSAGGDVLGQAVYNPASLDSISTNSTTLVDIGAGLQVGFTVPASGKVNIMLSGYGAVGAGANVQWGIREGTTDIAQAFVATPGNSHAGPVMLHVAGLTPGVFKTYKWAHRVTASGPFAFLHSGGTEGPSIMQVIAA